MGFYSLIHWVSLVLAGAALLLLLVLVLRQAFRNRHTRRDAQRRQSLMALALEYIEEPQFLPAFKAQLKPADQRLLVQLFGLDDSRGIMIDVDKEGRISINSKAVPTGASPEDLQARIAEMIKRLNKAAENVPVTVNADGDAKQRDVVAIMSAAAACGIKRMRVATLQSGGGN